MRKGLNRAFEIWPVTLGCRTLEPVTVLPQFRPQSQNTVSRSCVRVPCGCAKKEIRLLVFVVVLRRRYQTFSSCRAWTSGKPTCMYRNTSLCMTRRWHAKTDRSLYRITHWLTKREKWVGNQVYGISANIPFLRYYSWKNLGLARRLSSMPFKLLSF